MDGLSITFFNTTDKSSYPVSLDALSMHMEEQEGFYWCDLENPDVRVFEAILISLGVTAEWTNFFDKPDVLPHLKDTPAAVSFYLYDVRDAQSHLDSTKDIAEMQHDPMLLILGKHFVVTYHQRKIDLVDYIRTDVHANFQLAGKSPAFIVFLLAQHCLYNYARLNLANDNFLDLIELDLLQESQSTCLDKVSISGYNILTLKKINANLHIVLLVLVTKRSYVVTEEARASLHPLLSDTMGIRASIDSSRDLLDSVIVSAGTVEGRRTAEVVQVLTIVSAIFLPLTLIAGIYGMNFKIIPELHWKYGYYYALGLMTCVGLGSLFLLHHLGWLFSRFTEKKRGRRRKRH